MAEEFTEEVKTEARQFMSGLMSGEPAATATGEGTVDMAAWKATYAAASSKDASLMEQFWSIYDPSSTSVWTCVYDEADSNEELTETIEIATEFMKKTEPIKDHCFGVIHTLENLAVEGLWFFNGPDPEKLFGANEDTSWFTWSQLGPEPNENVKKAVANILAPLDGKLNGKLIKDTQAFC